MLCGRLKAFSYELFHQDLGSKGRGNRAVCCSTHFLNQKIILELSGQFVSYGKKELVVEAKGYLFCNKLEHLVSNLERHLHERMFMENSQRNGFLVLPLGWMKAFVCL